MVSLLEVIAAADDVRYAVWSGLQKHWCPNAVALKEHLADNDPRYPLTPEEMKTVSQKANMSGWQVAKALLVPVAEVAPVLGLIIPFGVSLLSHYVGIEAPNAQQKFGLFVMNSLFFAACVSLSFSTRAENEKNCRRMLAVKLLEHGRTKNAVAGFLEPMKSQERTPIGLQLRQAAWLNG